MTCILLEPIPYPNRKLAEILEALDAIRSNSLLGPMDDQAARGIRSPQHEWC